MGPLSQLVRCQAASEPVADALLVTAKSAEAVLAGTGARSAKEASHA
jgi:hypothetical protein